MKNLASRTNLIPKLLRTISGRSYVPRLFRALRRGPASMVVLGLLFGVALSSDARAAEFNAVIENLNNVTHPTARIDVSVDTSFGAGVDVIFIVYRASDGMQLSSFTLQTNANGFCSSSSAAAPNDNLFTASGGLPALVKVITPAGAQTSTAMVRQDLGESKIVFGMPAKRRPDGTLLAAGTFMAVAVGDLEKGTSLLIANVSSLPAEVNVFLGTSGVAGLRYTNPQLPVNAVWRVDLQPADANSHLIVSSSSEVTVQFVVNQGKTHITETAVVP